MESCMHSHPRGQEAGTEPPRLVEMVHMPDAAPSLRSISLSCSTLKSWVPASIRRIVGRSLHCRGKQEDNIP